MGNDVGGRIIAAFAMGQRQRLQQQEHEQQQEAFKLQQQILKHQLDASKIAQQISVRQMQEAQIGRMTGKPGYIAAGKSASVTSGQPTTITPQDAGSVTLPDVLKRWGTSPQGPTMDTVQGPNPIEMPITPGAGQPITATPPPNISAGIPAQELPHAPVQLSEIPGILPASSEVPPNFSDVMRMRGMEQAVTNTIDVPGVGQIDSRLIPFLTQQKANELAQKRFDKTQEFTASQNELNRANARNIAGAREAGANARAEAKANQAFLPSSKEVAAARGKLIQVKMAKDALKTVEEQFAKHNLATGAITGAVWSPAGKEYDASVSILRDLITALTRVPGIGAMSDFETRLATAKMPDRGLGETRDSMQIKLDGLKHLISTLEKGYGDIANAKKLRSDMTETEVGGSDEFGQFGGTPLGGPQ